MFNRFSLPNDLARQAQRIEEENFALNDYEGRRRGESIQVISGTLPIILSAPHAVGHFPITRKGKVKIKAADIHTGTLTMQLAEITGASAVIYKRSSDEEPNGTKPNNSPYKQTLAQVIAEKKPRFLLDIHGLDGDVKCEALIGSANGKSIEGNEDVLYELKKGLRQQAFKELYVDYFPWYGKYGLRFDADYPTSNTLWTKQEFNIAALQLEIGWYLRNFYNKHPDAYIRLLNGLTNAIQTIADLCK